MKRKTGGTAGRGGVSPAPRAEGMTEVPCVLVSNLTEAQRKAYILADNRLIETARWDEPKLAMELESSAALSFDTGVIGFDAASLDAFPAEMAKDRKTVPVNAHTRNAPDLTEKSGKTIRCPHCGHVFGV